MDTALKHAPDRPPGQHPTPLSAIKAQTAAGRDVEI